MNNISTLSENWIAHDTAYQNSLKRQSELIKTQQLKIQQQINQISKNVTDLSTALLTKNNKKEKWKPKPVGLGVDVAGVLGWTDENDETYRTYSPMVIFLSLTPVPNFRIETEVAAFFYSGVKLIRITDEQITTFNPTIGGEYIFGEHFSIGSEIGFPFAIANNDAAIGFGFNRLILRFYP